jgi:hypothetical protein
VTNTSAHMHNPRRRRRRRMKELAMRMELT